MALGFLWNGLSKSLIAVDLTENDFADGEYRRAWKTPEFYWKMKETDEATADR